MSKKVCNFAASFRTGRIELFVGPGQKAGIHKPEVVSDVR